MFWKLSSFPKCSHHVFLSHSNEDQSSLILPLHEKLLTSGVISWLDRDDYSYGRNSRDALRRAILDSRHVVFFVTDAMLNSSRGWCVFELAFSELLELNFQESGGQLANVFFPLFLVSQDDPRLPRSVWQDTRDRGRFHNQEKDGPAVEWCHDQICSFLIREQKLARNMSDNAKADKPFAKRLEQTRGLKERVTRFHPSSIRLDGPSS